MIMSIEDTHRPLCDNPTVTTGGGPGCRPRATIREVACRVEITCSKQQNSWILGEIFGGGNYCSKENKSFQFLIRISS